MEGRDASQDPEDEGRPIGEDPAASAPELLDGEPDAGGTNDLLGRVRRDEGDAVALLYERYQERVLLLARSVMGALLMRHMAPEDLRNQVLERVRPHLGQVRDSEHFRRLLYQHARWVAASEARKLQARKAEMHLSLEDEGAPAPADGGTTPSRRLQRAELQLRVADCMHALKESHRLVLQLKFFDGLSIAEAATELGRTPDATSMLLIRAQKSLRECLLRHGVEPTGA